MKNEATGQWEKVPSYSVEDMFPYGHGEKSVFLIERFMKLKVEEAVAIRWHMGGFDDALPCRGPSRSILSPSSSTSPTSRRPICWNNGANDTKKTTCLLTGGLFNSYFSYGISFASSARTSSPRCSSFVFC